MEIDKIIRQLKEQLLQANKDATRLRLEAKKKEEVAAALAKTIEQMENSPALQSQREPITYKDGVHPKTGAAKAKLLGILKKHAGKIRCSVINTEYEMGYGTQWSMTQKFPDIFKMAEVDGHETMHLLKDPDQGGQQ